MIYIYIHGRFILATHQICLQAQVEKKHLAKPKIK